MIELICLALFLYTWAIIGRIVLEYFQVPSEHPVGQVRRVLAGIVDPVLRPLRGIIPPVPIGGVRLDLSPIILFIGIRILRGIIC